PPFPYTTLFRSLLPRLCLRHELDPDLEVLLRLVEALGERLDERRALGLGDAELEPHRLGTPRPAGADEGLLPPREVGGRDDAGCDQRLEELPAGEDPTVVHRLPPFERWRGCNMVARRVSRPVAGVLSPGDRGDDSRRPRRARLGADLGGDEPPRALASAR